MIENMKPEVLYVFGGEEAQGAEIVIERLIYYNSANVNAHLIISPGNFADRLITAGKPYKITPLKSLKKLKRSKSGRLSFYIKAIIKYFMISYKILRYIRKNNITVIHANTIVPASYLVPAILYSKVFLRNKKWFWSDHDMKYFSALENRLAAVCVRLYNSTLVVSKAVQKKYPDAKKTLVLYNGLDTDVFKLNADARHSFRNKLNLNNDSMVLGIAASICPGKGQLQLLQVFNEICATYSNIILIIAGTYARDDVKYNNSVRAAISANSKVIYLGYADDVAEFYNGCDIVINNSDLFRSESLGTSIYEAMACERVLVASATGGTPEIITNNIDGYLFEPENPAQLKIKLCHAIDNYKKLMALKTSARNKVKVKFNINGMIEHYNQLLIN
jgi:glycosyltransferase involved in cell wall biosynthesis